MPFKALPFQVMMLHKYSVAYHPCKYVMNVNHSALQLLTWLKTQETFAQVLHPADPNNVSHQFWKETCQTEQSAGLVSVIFKPEYDMTAIRKFCDHLKLFKLGFSWGGPVSLVMLYNLADMRHLEHSHLQQGLLVRFCIGLEDADDLIQDIEHGLKVIQS